MNVDFYHWEPYMEQKRKPKFIEKLATHIVDRRSLVFLIFAALCVFSIFSTGWVKINQDLTKYLSKDSETRIGLDIMDAEFTEFATAKIMVSNVTFDMASELAGKLADIDGVHGVEFDNTADHYNAASALFTVTFDGATDAEVTVTAFEHAKELLSAYDTYISTEINSPKETIIENEMLMVDAIAFVIIVTVLLFTSRTYMEIPILLVTFGAAALINMGTNYIFGTISYVTDSITIVLQLALAIDYAIILVHRYTEERAVMPAHEAVVTALSKAIPEIGASSMTTISGLVALTLMSFKLGYDIGIILIKAIIISMLTVFTLMPGLLMLFSKQIDKTHHKNFVPRINFWGRMTYKTRYVIPPIFLVIVVAACIFANRCPYVYGYSTLDTYKQNEVKTAEKTIAAAFGTDNFIALLVPEGDYVKESALLAELETYPQIKSTLAMTTIEAKDGYMLTDALTPRQFSELADIDVDIVRTLYTAYGVNNEDYGRIVADVDSYTVPLVDMIEYLYERSQEGYVELDSDTYDTLEDMHAQILFAKAQLESDSWSRMVLYLNLPEESDETFEYLDTIHAVTAKYYDEAYLAGESVNDYDLSKSFSNDNLLISILSAVFVIIVLLFSFRSVGLPVLLILVIQSSIWINFSFPYLLERNLFFIAYLIVSSIQMGANIDYAIVISSRYMELKREMPIRDAMIETLNQAFPTIITSGLMMAFAGFIIGFMSSENTISSIGFCLGRGTSISIFLVMGVLPQILLLGDIIIEKTSFTIRKPNIISADSGTIRLRGRVRGQVSGFIDADVNGLFRGSINAMVDIGDAEVISGDEPKLTAEVADEGGRGENE